MLLSEDVGHSFSSTKRVQLDTAGSADFSFVICDGTVEYDSGPPSIRDALGRVRSTEHIPNGVSRYRSRAGPRFNNNPIAGVSTSEQ